MKIQLTRCVLWVAAGLLMLGSVTAVAEEKTETKSSLQKWAEQDYMLGDWGGLRTDLSKHGVDFEFFYAGSVPDNLSGGIKRGGLYQGGLLMSLDLNSDKLVGYEGGTFHASGIWLQGQKPFSDNFVGDLNKVNMLDFPNAARLWELYYQQALLDGKLSIKVGELSVDRDFLVPEFYNSLGSFTLINQTFFYPTVAFDVFGFPFPGNHGLPSTPNAAPGAVVRWNALPQVYAQAGVYGGNPDQSYSGTHFPLSEAGGALAYFEVGYRLNQQTNDTGLPGSYKLGGYYHTGDFVDMQEGLTAAAYAQLNDLFAAQGLPAAFPTAEPTSRSGDYGVYFLAEQQFFKEQSEPDPAHSVP